MNSDNERLVTIAEAAKIAEVSERTVWRWISEKKLTDKREVCDKRIPIVIRQNELLGFLATRDMTEKRRVTRHDTRQVTREKPVSQPVVSPSYLEKLLEAVTSERNRLIQEHEADRREIERLREKNDSLIERIASLEREIHSLGGSGRGILGYLSKGFKRLVK